MNPLSLGLTPAQLSMESNFRSSAPGSDVVSLFHEHHLAVYHYLLRMLGARPEAEDITQEAFLRLHTQLSEGATIGNARNWLFRVAHNLAIDCMRQNRIGEQGCFVPFAAGHDIAVAGQESAEQRMLADEKQQRLEAALNWLSPQQRQCLELRAEGLSYREIGETLGIHISSVRTFIARALAKIAERIDD